VDFLWYPVRVSCGGRGQNYVSWNNNGHSWLSCHGRNVRSEINRLAPSKRVTTLIWCAEVTRPAPKTVRKRTKLSETLSITRPNTFRSDVHANVQFLVSSDLLMELLLSTEGQGPIELTKSVDPVGHHRCSLFKRLVPIPRSIVRPCLNCIPYLWCF
jgi:hypothetical protein